jgi:hypothetical protein
MDWPGPKFRPPRIVGENLLMMRRQLIELKRLAEKAAAGF